MAMKRKQTNYRERAQPMARRRFGLLEKKKDYKVRAERKHEKDRHIKALREAASLRNKDEFNTGMVGRKIDAKGIQVELNPDDIEERNASVRDRSELTRANVNYVRMKRQMDRNKIERLHSSLHFIDQEDDVNKDDDDDFDSSDGDRVSPEAAPRHIVFVDSKKRKKRFRADKYFDTLPEFVGRRHNRPRRAQLASADFILDERGQQPTKEQLRQVEQMRTEAYDELSARLERLEQLDQLEREAALEQQLRTAGHRKKMVDRDGNVTYKWKRQRKR
jgi:U3 small nucleolar RNA-associated protein 11